ncbi:MAG: hypothetical protein ABEJ30_09395 [Halorientalis sp.]
MTERTIEVDDSVYEMIVENRQSDESPDDTLQRLLDIDTGAELGDDSDADSAIDRGDVYQGGTDMWTVYDKLADHQREGESLQETMERLK